MAAVIVTHPVNKPVYIRVAEVREKVFIRDEEGVLQEAVGCYYPTLQDIKQHHPKHFGYTVTAD